MSFQSLRAGLHFFIHLKDGSGDFVILGQEGYVIALQPLHYRCLSGNQLEHTVYCE